MLATDGLGDFWRVLLVAAIVLAFLLSFVLRYAAWAFMTGRRKRKQLEATAASATDEVRPPE
ncbi:MAG: hypothetical protein ABIQ73_18090 [Acidimicrobiales bacterium]